MSRRRRRGRKRARAKTNPKLLRSDREAAARAQEVTQRAIRRLDLFEWLVWGVGALMALTAGAGIAWMMGVAAGWSFRPTWLVFSMLLFVIPGGVAIIQMRKDERGYDSRMKNWMSKDG
ncbi:MAG: hypothetical protein CMH51_01600 [Myxococcales bacterium]|jgi:uncharacterized membrane protein|nr:hypothetical protein [Myxococcales bacterium]